MLGWPGAYRFGDGCIMLQARTPNATVRVGKNCRFSNNISMIATESIEIGDGCLIGDLVSIMDSDFHGIAPAQRHSGSFKTAPVKLGNNVWLGSRVLVLKGVTIGETSVVAAGSIVTSSLPPNCIAAGVPARALRMIDVGPGHTG
jgi:maltose O-acetyltransferase